MAILVFKSGEDKSITHYNSNTDVTSDIPFVEIDFDTVVSEFMIKGNGVTSFELTEGPGRTITFVSPSVVEGREYELMITATDNNPKYAPTQSVIDYVYALI